MTGSLATDCRAVTLQLLSARLLAPLLRHVSADKQLANDCSMLLQSKTTAVIRDITDCADKQHLVSCLLLS